MAKGALTRALHNSKLHRNSNVSDKSLQNLFPLNRSRMVEIGGVQSRSTQLRKHSSCLQNNRAQLLLLVESPYNSLR